LYISLAASQTQKQQPLVSANAQTRGSSEIRPRRGRTFRQPQGCLYTCKPSGFGEIYQIILRTLLQQRELVAENIKHMKNKNLQIRNSTAEFLVFTKQAGESTIDVRIEDETVWLTQKLLAVLFEVDVRTVSEHLKNIFSTHELEENSVIRKFRTTAADGKSYNTQFNNIVEI
jgi:hypothetical protein